MKKIFILLTFTLFGATLFAVSYVNNTYQKLANEYSRKAQSALNAGEYELSVEYAKKAEENAALSKAYIDKMMLKGSADKEMTLAQKKLEWAKTIYADRNFPIAYSSADATAEVREQIVLEIRKHLALYSRVFKSFPNIFAFDKRFNAINNLVIKARKELKNLREKLRMLLL